MPTEELPYTDELIAQLDSFIQGALTIYDVMKAVPHPYNSVAGMTNTWAHDFINFAFKTQGLLAAERARADAAEARYSELVARTYQTKEN
jgi:hypothetical protein